MKLTPSLRVKFTLALLFTSLLSLALAGLVARSILYREFNHVLMNESFRRFHLEMTEYFKTYGSWEKAQKVEGFGDFERRRRARFGAAPETALRETRVQTPRGSSAGEGSTSDVSTSIQQEKERPPFRFMLTNPSGRILLGNKKGTQAPNRLLQQGRPVVVKGKTLAIALPDPSPNFNNLDIGYLAAVRQALIYASIAAGVLALVLGLFVGERLGRRLSTLTGAIRSMEKGELLQHVDVEAKDEIGELTSAFNRMSEELARAHEELQQSHQQIQAQAQMLKELSIRDGLTKLFNRRYFDEQGARMFAETVRYHQPLTVMIGDIDFFKKINDNFSHATGDEVLRRVAQLLESMTRESDMVARYGGEEFVITFPQTSLDAATALCEKLRRVIELHPWLEIHPDLRVTMSMGLCDDAGLGSFEKMIAAADENLYRAKKGGRNRVVSGTVRAGLNEEVTDVTA